MRKTLVAALLALVAININAADQNENVKSNKPVFTVVKQIPITSIKDQNRSGTCWDYSTLSYFEAEILKKTGKTYDLCESFVANKTYMDRATQVIRLHGDCQFAQGGSAYDVLYTLEHYGICPESAMPFPGSLYGDSLNNFNEFFSLMEPYVSAIAKNKANKISGQWKVGLQGIIDAYLGKCPENFTYEGKKYTPKSFAASCFDEETRPNLEQFGTNCLRMGRRLEEGFVVTDEPGIYFIPALIDEWRAKKHCAEFLNFDKLDEYKDFGGIRLEDDILITKDGCRFIGKDRIPYHPKDVEEFIAANRK